VKLRHLLVLTLIFFTLKGFAQLKEPTSDPLLDASDKQTEEAIDDAADVKLRPSPQKYVERPEDAPKKPAPKADVDSDPTAKFSVTRVRMAPAGGSVYHSIQLVAPQHNSTYTPGVITFSWKFVSPTKSKKKRYVILKVERLDGKKKYSRKVSKEKKMLDLSPGDYKWQVASEKSAQDSRWRLFRVIGMKSHSVTDLYNGQGPPGKKAPPLKKNVILPEVSDYIIDLDGPDEDDERIPASNEPPLDPPDWIRPH
jgi:hypothetical protein